MHRGLLVWILVAGCGGHAPPSGPAAARWQTLPPAPAMPPAAATGDVEVGDARIHYALYGRGSPVVLLHGAMSNGEHWALQVPALAANHQVVVIDSRGHGRSTLGSQGLHYAQMANDVVAVLDSLKVDRASFVGWSDGGIIALELARHHSDRVNRVFAFGANSDTTAYIPHGTDAPVIKQVIERAVADTARLAHDPKRPDELG